MLLWSSRARIEVVNSVSNRHVNTCHNSCIAGFGNFLELCGTNHTKRIVRTEDINRVLRCDPANRDCLQDSGVGESAVMKQSCDIVFIHSLTLQNRSNEHVHSGLDVLGLINGAVVIVNHIPVIAVTICVFL